MNILALDIGTKCGWAVADESAPPLPMPPRPGQPSLLGGDIVAASRTALRHYHHGVWTTDGYRGRFYLRFSDWLTKKIDTFDVGLLAIEASVEGWLNMAAPKQDDDGKWRRKTNPETIRKLLGIVAVCETVAAARDVPIKEINPSAMTRLAVGTGRDPGKKDRKKRGRDLGLRGCDNELDAIYGLSWVLQDRRAAAQAARREAA